MIFKFKLFLRAQEPRIIDHDIKLESYAKLSEEFKNNSNRHCFKSIIAFLNPKSGGQKGQAVYEELLEFLSKDNVFDLSKTNPIIA